MRCPGFNRPVKKCRRHLEPACRVRSERRYFFTGLQKDASLKTIDLPLGDQARSGHSRALRLRSCCATRMPAVLLDSSASWLRSSAGLGYRRQCIVRPFQPRAIVYGDVRETGRLERDERT